MSAFGIVPAAIMGLDVGRLLEGAGQMVDACGTGSAAAQNPGVLLGTILGVAATQGRDKLTLFASPGIASLGGWLEQLVAESTGKSGKGDRVPSRAEQKLCARFLERELALVRPALLTSALGYSMAALAIILDVGRWWGIWKIPLGGFPDMGRYNFDSALLEVALCVMAYIVLLWIELSPAFLEKWAETGKGALGKLARTISPSPEESMLLRSPRPMTNLRFPCSRSDSKASSNWRTPSSSNIPMRSSVRSRCGARTTISPPVASPRARCTSSTCRREQSATAFDSP